MKNERIGIQYDRVEAVLEAQRLFEKLILKNATFFQVGFNYLEKVRSELLPTKKKKS